MNMAELVGKYIQLRDKKDGIKAEYAKKVADIDATLDKVEAKIMSMFNDTGIESMKTDFGTAYKSTVTSAKVADWDATLTYIKTNEAWDMLERRVSKKVVEEYVEEHGTVPPGVDISRKININIRRS